ncbi:cytochrome P450 [Streptomyces sp. N35]|uniref:cytochrome P450 n=1 Tax=Streptomyces sp. N35 TaxID=2795730 RepID=UPI0018F47C47|nr:cytochrome P450 [Streptomyces sp. N35]
MSIRMVRPAAPVGVEDGLKPWAAIPELPGGKVPWLGHGPGFGKDPVLFLRAGRELAGDLFRFTLMGRPAVFACGATAHEQVFKADEATLSAADAYPFMEPIFGSGVAFDAGPQEMARQMGHLAPLLAGSSLKSYPGVMQQEIEQCLATWGDEGEIDLVPAITELVGAISVRCLLGREVRERLGPETIALYRELASGIRLAALLNPRLPIPAFRRRDRARARIAQELQRAIDARRHGPHTHHGDLLQSLLDSPSPQGEPVQDDDILIGILIAMTFAGVHNSAGLAVWSGVVLLDQGVHALPPVMAELHSIMRSDSSLTVERLHRMELLGHCIREAERLYPPSFLLLRKARKAFVLEGHEIPPGTLVMLSPTVSHRMESVFSEPGRCDPSRFAQGRAEHKHPYSLIAFGGGQHRCIGLAFAYLEIQAIWSVLLRRFHLELLGGPHRPQYATSFVAEPNSPCVLRYRRRRDDQAQA